MDLFKIGQNLSLFIEDRSKLVEIRSTISGLLDDRMVVELPPYFMRYINFLQVGCKLTVKVFSKMGTVDFNTVVIASPLEDNFCIELDYNAMKLTPSEEIPTVDAIEKLIIRVGEENEISVKTFELATDHIKFYCDTKLNVDDSFNCELILPKDYGTIKFKATVTDADPVYDNEFTAVYSNMTEDDRQALLYYMYLYSNSTD